MQLTIEKRQHINTQINRLEDSDSVSDDAQNLFNELSPMSENDMIFQKLNPDSDQIDKPKRLKSSKNQAMKKKRLEKQKADKKRQKRQKKHKNKKLKKEHEQNNDNQQEKNPFAQDSLPREQFSLSQSVNQSSQSDASDHSKPANLLKSQKRNKKNRKKRVEQDQGFNLEQLGNQPKSFVASDDSDASYNKGKKGKKDKKLKRQKIKKQVAKNQEIIQKLLQKGNYAEDQEDGQQCSHQEKKYFTGIQFDRLFKNNKKQKEIKVFNKLFQNLDFDDQIKKQKQAEQDQSKNKDNGDNQNNINITNEQIPEFQKMNLELKPRQSGSSISQRSSFLQRMEHLKKQRGMEFKLDQEQFSNANKQRQKKSLMKMIDCVDPLNFEEDIDIKVNIPEIAKGRSSAVMNNSLFLKKSMDSHKNSDNIGLINFSKTQSCQVNFERTSHSKGNLRSRKHGKDRRTLFEQMQGQIRKRRSKYISFQDIKENFKITKLEQIQEDRKQIEQRRRKAAILGVDSDNSQLDQQEYEMFNNKQQKQNAEQDDGKKQNLKEKNDFDELIDQQKGKQSNNSRLQRLMERDDEFHKTNRIKQHQDDQQQEENMQIDGQGQQAEIQSQCSKMEGEQDLIGDVILSSQNSQRDQEDAQMEIQGESQEEQSNPQQPNQQDIQNVQQIDAEQQQNEQFLKSLEDEGINIKKRIKFVPEPIQQKSQEEILDIKSNNKKETQKNQCLQDIDKVDFNQFQRLYPEEFTRQEFKKLRKIANVIANKKKTKEQRRKRAQQYFDEQAELGSDNQDHDQEIKRIDRKAQQKEYQGVDLDADLEQLIDNAVNLNEQDQQEAFKKYLEDVKMKDKEELRKIIRGQFRERKKQIDVELQDDEKQRQSRMEQVMDWIQKRQAEDNKDLYAKSQISQNQDSNSNKSNKPCDLNLPVQDSQQYANFEDLATYLEDNIMSNKMLSTKVDSQISLEKCLPQQKKKDVKPSGVKRSSLLDSSLTSKKSICAFSAEQAKFSDTVKLKASKKSSSSSLNQILMKNKKKIEVKKPVVLFGTKISKKT